MKQAEKTDIKIINSIVSILNSNGFEFNFNYDDLGTTIHLFKTHEFIDSFGSLDLTKILSSTNVCNELLGLIKKHSTNHIIISILPYILHDLGACDDISILEKFSKFDICGYTLNEILFRRTSYDLAETLPGLPPEICENIARNIINNIGFDKFCETVLDSCEEQGYSLADIPLIMLRYYHNGSSQEQKFYDTLSKFRSNNYSQDQNKSIGALRAALQKEFSDKRNSQDEHAE